MPIFLRRWRSERSEPNSEPNLGPPAPEGDLRAEFLAHPENRRTFDRWVTALRNSGLPDAGVRDAVAAVQGADPRPIPLALLHLLTHGTAEEQWRHRFAAQLGAFARSGPARDCRQVWRDYTRLHPLDPAVAERVRKLSPGVIQLTFMTAEPPYRRVGGVSDSAWTVDHAVPAKGHGRRCCRTWTSNGSDRWHRTSWRLRKRLPVAGTTGSSPWRRSPTWW